MSVLLYRCTTWTLAICMEKKLDENYYVLFWTNPGSSSQLKQQLYDHLPLISETKTKSIPRGSKDELISDVLLWTPTHGRISVRRPVRTYINQLCADTGCCLEVLLRVMGDRDGCQFDDNIVRIGSEKSAQYISPAGYTVFEVVTYAMIIIFDCPHFEL